MLVAPAFAPAEDLSQKPWEALTREEKIAEFARELDLEEKRRAEASGSGASGSGSGAEPE